MKKKLLNDGVFSIDYDFFHDNFEISFNHLILVWEKLCILIISDMKFKWMLSIDAVSAKKQYTI